MREDTLFYPLSKRNQFLILATFFTIAVLSLVFFSNGFFHQDNIKIMFKFLNSYST